MKPILCIPTYNRPDGITIERCQHLSLEKLLFIRKEQEPIYKAWRAKGYNLVTIPEDIKEIGKTRRYIAYWCNKNHKDWAFMFDDDVSKVEILGQKSDGSWNSQRIIDGSKTPPRFEEKALHLWFKLAKQHNLSLSSPNHRAYDRFHHGPNIRVNKSAPIQCVLIHIPSIVDVGNYQNSRKIGNEDLYMIYKLMTRNLKTGKIGLIEYDCASMGNIEDGTSDSFKEKYERFVKCFKKNVCDDPDLIGVKTTSTGVPSIQFKWKNWNGYTIELEE